jgi:membrane protein YdbS with pleckstrin-like domain
MNKETEKSEKEPFQFTPKHFTIVIPVVLILSIGILSAAIYLFLNPGLISGIVFGIVMLVFFVVPLILAIVFYFKKVKTPIQEITEKKKIEIQRVE